MDPVSAVLNGVGAIFGFVGNIMANRTERMRIRLERDILENPFRELKNNLYDDGTDPLIIYSAVGVIVLIIILAVMYIKPKAKA